MSYDPILLMGGSGNIGRHTATAIRARYPDVPLLIGVGAIWQRRSTLRRKSAMPGASLLIPIQRI